MARKKNRTKNVPAPVITKSEFKRRATKNVGFSVEEVAATLGYSSARVYQFLNGVKKDGEVYIKPVVKPSWGVYREKQDSYKTGTLFTAGAVEKLAEVQGRDLLFA